MKYFRTKFKDFVVVRTGLSQGVAWPKKLHGIIIHATVSYRNLPLFSYRQQKSAVERNRLPANSGYVDATLILHCALTSFASAL